ncbi:inorganic phosphate transporter [Hydrogenispora sp. UU3]|uniref:Inorganic phosphate transporter n=1 Tax=Capillibacterium thermochitinicola TaxID=2699427 RepID=A0A8J6LMP1_9FIRM|nr:inorganic phosphate transporter [Capillibacterium thermochitinicola]MBA2132993.1 inorganic phosphate transporter [Capillibacterium thermochitinicola]
MGGKKVPLLLFAFIVFLILAAEFVNGWTDAPNAIATVVATKALKPRTAVVLAVTGNILGAFYGQAVAQTIGTEIVRPDAINLVTLGAALIGIVVWATAASWFGIPTSESHALLAGLAGAGLATAGPAALLLSGWKKIFLGLVISVLFGAIGGFSLVWVLKFFSADWSPRKTNRIFNTLQIVAAAGMAFSHGSNDGQKFIGLFTLTLVLSGFLPVFQVQPWVVLLCSVVMGAGTSVGGWRIIEKVGSKMVKLEPDQGLAAQTAAAASILFASSLGVPLSTTHTITTAIMGAGTTRGLSAVNWGVAKELVLAWVFTFPVCGLIGYLTAWILTGLF